MESITFDEYERDERGATGYKVYLKNEQVATLEYRSREWIAAIFEEGAIATFQNKCYFKAVAWIRLMIKKTHKKRE